jgi:hypothetical protein
MNCDRYCRADSTSSNGRRLSTAAGSADYSNWCMCINYNYDVLFRDYDTSIPKDNSLTKQEFSEMFDAASDFFYINWPSKAQLYFEECDTDGNDFMEGNELTDCYTLNCDRECTVSNTVTDDDIRIKKWCGCRYNDYTVVMEQWDVSPLDQKLSLAEVEEMIEEWTGDNLTEWPYNSQASFDDCDLNADGKIDEAETEKCYDKRCVRSCSTQADVDARTDNWCQCRERSYEVVTEQFAG